MATRWRQRRIRRRLRSLCEPGEHLEIIERLGLGGWWVLSDRALYVLGRGTDPERLPVRELRSARVTPGSTTVQVTVTTATGRAVIGDLPHNSELAVRLRGFSPS